MYKISLCFLLFFITSCSSTTKLQNLPDENLWLEDIEGAKSMDWVNKHNTKTLQALANTAEFEKIKSQALTILESKDKIPYGEIAGNFVYNFWQDSQHTRGIWRRATLNEYKKNNPKWELLLDLDALSKKENENWVFKGYTCLKPSHKLCFLNLSRGGKDAIVIKEFNTDSKSFVVNGFTLPEAKSQLSWVDENHVLVSTDFGPNSLTDSGYPSEIKLWQRETPLSQAQSLFKAEKNDMIVSSTSLYHSGQLTNLVIRNKDFYTQENFILNKSEKLELAQIPDTADVVGLFNDYLIIQIKKDWQMNGKFFVSGSALAIPKNDITNPKLSPEKITAIFTPNNNSSLLSISVLKNKIILNVLENVQGKLLSVGIKNNIFLPPQPLTTPLGHTLLDSSDSSSDEFFFKLQSFLIPESLYSFKNTFQKIKSLPQRFNSSDMEFSQRWSQSADGTKIPYFLVGKKQTLKKGNAPTLLYGYGGFEVSLTPSYNGILGKLWLEKGGVYALANIRGGGEFGPKWHQASLKKNRQKSYDDFISVAEDLIKNKITSSQKLAIQGGSNGGLLVGAVMVQRPELFNAVVCQVPLLDMIRYSQLLAGASWMAEYGDPNDSEMREAILKYSPYQNVIENKKYPHLLLMTSTKDDRVHPGHARKMMAKLEKINQPNLYYYENTEGGHAASANFKQRAHMQALAFSFLYKSIF